MVLQSWDGWVDCPYPGGVDLHQLDSYIFCLVQAQFPEALIQNTSGLLQAGPSHAHHGPHVQHLDYGLGGTPAYTHSFWFPAMSYKVAAQMLTMLMCGI